MLIYAKSGWRNWIKLDAKKSSQFANWQPLKLDWIGNRPEKPEIFSDWIGNWLNNRTFFVQLGHPRQIVFSV